LYRNLGFFAFSFSLIDRAFAVFGMADLLPGTESSLARGLFDGNSRHAELLAAAGEKLRDVLDRVVGLSREGGRGTAELRPAGPPGAAVPT